MSAEGSRKRAATALSDNDFIALAKIFQTSNQDHCGKPNPEIDHRSIEQVHDLASEICTEYHSGNSMKHAMPVDVLLETANVVEFETALLHLSPVDGTRPLYVRNGISIYFGMFHEKVAALVRTGQGSTSREGSGNVTKTILPFLKPKIIVLAGVAFGTPATLSPDKKNATLRLGDVLVASKIQPYDHARAGKKVELRAEPILVDGYMVEKLKDLAGRWNTNNKARYITDSEQLDKMRKEIGGLKENAAQAVVGTLLSGGKLLDDAKLHKSLIKQAKAKSGQDAILGGEMEGVGASACQNSHTEVPVLIIKGICDWGMAKTKGFQHHAAAAAFAFTGFAIKELCDVSSHHNQSFRWPSIVSANVVDIGKHFPNLIEPAKDVVRCNDELSAALETAKYNKLSKKIERMEKELKEEKSALKDLTKAKTEALASAQTMLNEMWPATLISNKITFGYGTGRIELERKFSEAVPTLTQPVVKAEVDPITFKAICDAARARSSKPPVSFKIKKVGAAALPSDQSEEDDEH